VMIGGAKAKDISNITIHVYSAEVKPSNTFELLGVTFDQRFTVRPYLTTLVSVKRKPSSRRPSFGPAALHG
jgi:hypothetical protein